jgi:hypothetical protein
MNYIIASNYPLKMAAHDSRRALLKHRIRKCIRLGLILPNAITAWSILLAFMAASSAALT